MNNNINIAEILKDYPKGTKLYSPLFGDVTLEEVDSTWAATVKIRYKPNSFTNFFKTGLYYNYEGAECLLFPSSEMRDWTKFFKRGDVVIKHGGGMAAVFDGWANDTYTEFNTTVNLYCDNNTGEEEVCDTLLFRKATDKERKQFIEKAERILKGKYNPETLQIEPVKPVKVEYSFKPFDKVLVRDDIHERWRISIFSNYLEKGDYPYACMNGVYRYCIPYNEQTTHLVDINKSYNP